MNARDKKEKEVAAKCEYARKTGWHIEAIRNGEIVGDFCGDCAELFPEFELGKVDANNGRCMGCGKL